MKFLIGFIIVILGIVSCSRPSRIETFTFSSNGAATNGKIFLPASYETNKNLPAIYLIDFTEQAFKIATDEFEKVIDGIRQIQGFDALVVTLNEHHDIDAKPQAFQEYYDVFRNMTLFLEDSESSVFDNFIATDPASSFNSAVISIIEKDDFPKNKLRNKIHFQ